MPITVGDSPIAVSFALGWMEIGEPFCIYFFTTQNSKIRTNMFYNELFDGIGKCLNSSWNEGVNWVLLKGEQKRKLSFMSMGLYLVHCNIRRMHSNSKIYIYTTSDNFDITWRYYILFNQCIHLPNDLIMVRRNVNIRLHV